MSSTGMLGMPAAGYCPKNESQMRVKTPALASPPRPRMKSRARTSAGSLARRPASFSAKYASVVTDT
jgi:hypothetical protein